LRSGSVEDDIGGYGGSAPREIGVFV